jgi:hypothetical protein
MSLEAIQREIETWDGENLRKLMLFVASLRRSRENPARASELARLVDDKSSGQWVESREGLQRLDRAE